MTLKLLLHESIVDKNQGKCGRSEQFNLIGIYRKLQQFKHVCSSTHNIKTFDHFLGIKQVSTDFKGLKLHRFLGLHLG